MFEKRGIPWVEPEDNDYLKREYGENRWIRLITSRAQDCIVLADNMYPLDPLSNVEEALEVFLDRSIVWSFFGGICWALNVGARRVVVLARAGVFVN